MSIQKFHAKIASAKEKSALFEAFRRLSQIKNPIHIVRAQELRGWPQWYAE